MTDRVETTFLNLLRGCGRNGFIGMQFCDTSPLLSSAKVLRPLLGLSKSYITSLCDQNKLSYFTDPTTGKYYRPKSTFEVTGENLEELFEEVSTD